jgi:hypothetical protein
VARTTLLCTATACPKTECEAATCWIAELHASAVVCVWMTAGAVGVLGLQCWLPGCSRNAHGPCRTAPAECEQH